MSSLYLVVLIPLALTYNPDKEGNRKPLEEKKLEDTMNEVVEMFGGGVLHRSLVEPPTGFWHDQGYIHEDTLAFLEVDIPDNPESVEKMTSYVENVLGPRFQQKAMYMRLIGPVRVRLISISTDQPWRQGWQGKES